MLQKLVIISVNSSFVLLKNVYPYSWVQCFIFVKFVHDIIQISYELLFLIIAFFWHAIIVTVMFCIHHRESYWKIMALFYTAIKH